MYEVGGAHGAGHGLVPGVGIDREHPARTRQPRALDQAEADAPGAEHRHVGASADLGRDQRRAHTGGDGASDAAGFGGGRLGVHLEQHVVAHHRILREGAEPAEAGYGTAVERERLMRHGAPGHELLAHVDPPGSAVAAFATIRHHERNDPVANGEIDDLLADLHDTANRFMTGNEREGVRHLAIEHQQVNVAEPSGLHGEHHLARTRIAQGDLHDAERFSDGHGDSGFAGDRHESVSLLW